MRKFKKDEILNMTVAQLITETNFKIKLGGDKGSSFIYCGMAKDIDPDSLDKTILDGYAHTIKIQKRQVKTISETPKGYNDYEKIVQAKRQKAINKKLKWLTIEMERTGQDGNINMEKLSHEAEEEFPISRDLYKKWRDKLERDLDRAKTTLKRTQKRVDTFTSIRSRKIKDIYPSIDEINTYIVLYDGREVGRYWTTKEYETGVIEKEADDE